ncbi:vitamin K epoxide reductase family protein [Candidatus Marsarchaeota archaeon]|nr:vitamin K epoxide reductase family protein [Candidatus Marsarchaeota archaeon]MCL5092212.1 vitamin K epoxide reductase family protein [Candidatus Marsarchaeota archaeon]
MNITFRRFIILISMSLIGLASSIFVIYKFYTLHQQLPLCNIGSQASNGIVVDCAKVLLSPYSSINIFGISIHLEVLAAVWFIINILLVTAIAVAGERFSKKALKVLFGWRFFGIVLVPYLIYLELFVLKAICTYCTIMHVAIIMDFIVISYLLFYKKDKNNVALIA